MLKLVFALDWFSHIYVEFLSSIPYSYNRTALLVTNYVDFACGGRHVCDFSS